AAGDDVDHAGDGVGAVDGRGAVLQHLDAVHQRQRDGVEVHRGAHAGARGLVHPADAVHSTSTRLGPRWRRSTVAAPAPTPPPSGGKPKLPLELNRVLRPAPLAVRFWTMS